MGIGTVKWCNVLLDSLIFARRFTTHQRRRR